MYHRVIVSSCVYLLLGVDNESVLSIMSLLGPKQKKSCRLESGLSPLPARSRIVGALSCPSSTLFFVLLLLYLAWV